MKNRSSNSFCLFQTAIIPFALIVCIVFTTPSFAFQDKDQGATPVQEDKQESKDSDATKSDQKKDEGENADEAKSEAKSEDNQKSVTDNKDDAKNKNEDAKPAKKKKATFDRESEEIRKVFQPTIASIRDSTVRVMSGRRTVAYGTVVDSGGYVLTKASELKGALTCKLNDGRSLPATVHGIHKNTDLAMLKIEATELPAANWGQAEVPQVGFWLASVGSEEIPMAIGVVSVASRKINAPSGFMGVQLDDHEKGVRITQVFARSPAEKAGILINDIVFELNGNPIKDRIELISSVKEFHPGDKVQLQVHRGDEEVKITVTLGERNKIDPANNRSNFQNSMGGRLSNRRLDFPLAFQHDTPLSPNQCGGTIVDLNGNIVGVNIARAGRVDTLALPISVVIPAIAKLKTGELAPNLINKSKIADVEKRLKELNTEIIGLPEEELRMKSQLEVETAREEELERILEDVQTRLAELKKSRSDSKKAYDEAKDANTRLTREKQRLERELKSLTTGTK